MEMMLNRIVPEVLNLDMQLHFLVPLLISFNSLCRAYLTDTHVKDLMIWWVHWIDY